MFEVRELLCVSTYLLWFCVIIAIAHLFRKVIFRKVTGLPSSRKNNLLVYIKLMVFLFKNKNLVKNPILYVVSSVSHRYRKSGLVHFHIPFHDIVFLFQPDTVQPLLKSASNIDRPIIYTFFKEWLGSSLLLRNGDSWRERRKLLTPAFHLKMLDKFVPVIEKHAKILVKKLTQHDETKFVNVNSLVTHCVLNVLCETALGVNTEDSKYDLSTYGKHLDILLNIIQERTLAIWQWPDIIFRLTQKGRKFQESLTCLNEITNQIVQERISRTEKEERNKTADGQYSKLAFLDILLNSFLNDRGITLEDISKEVQLFLFAGHDTSALTILWTLYLLGKNLDVQRKVREEIDAVLGDDPDRPLTKNDLWRLKYTECVIKETLRMYPVVPLIARKIKETMTVGKHVIPEGYVCVVSIYDMHRNPDIFPNPEEFNPERFFPENCVGRHPFVYVPFSAGQRNCIGQKFAFMEMKIILAKIMQNVAFESADQNVETEYAITFRPKDPVRLKVKRR